MSDSKSIANTGFRGYQQAFTAYIRNPKKAPVPVGANKRRMKVYADIVLNNMDATISACYPVCKLILGKRAWRQLVMAFLREHAANTPIFREIPEQFLSFLKHFQMTSDVISIPPFLYALAHYEWAELKVSINPAHVAIMRCAPEVLLEAKPEVNPTLLNLSYQYPVHTISKRRQPRDISVQPVYLLVYRTIAHEVKFIETNAMTASLINLLQKGTHTGEQALGALVSANSQEHAESIRIFGAELLHQLQQQEVLIGVKEG